MHINLGILDFYASGLGGSSDISLGLKSGLAASITILWYAFSTDSDAG